MLRRPHLHWITIPACAALLTQNVTEAFLTHMSRQNGAEYRPITVVLLQDFLKICISVFMITVSENRSLSFILQTFSNTSRLEWMTIAVPATMYTIQNNLRFLALENLSSSIYQVLQQLKILTTAIFSMIFLNRRFHRIQWIALVLLICGLLFVEIQSHGHAVSNSDSQKYGNVFVGTAAVGVICVCSGLAGTWTEKVVKANIKTSIWLVNIQLSLFSILYNVLTMFYQKAAHGTPIFSDFFKGYGLLTWVVVLAGCVGGILVGIVVRYTSSLAKTYLISAAIFLNAIVDSLLLPNSRHITAEFWIAVMVVFCSVILFNDPVNQQIETDKPSVNEKQGKFDFAKQQYKETSV